GGVHHELAVAEPRGDRVRRAGARPTDQAAGCGLDDAAFREAEKPAKETAEQLVENAVERLFRERLQELLKHLVQALALDDRFGEARGEAVGKGPPQVLEELRRLLRLFE